MFHSMRNLRNLYFSYNKLTDIDAEGLLKYVPKLENADIRGYFLSCYKLLEIVHKLGKHGVSVVHGVSTTGHNIYGMNCTEVDDSVDEKEKYNSPEIREGYAALVNYFNKDFRNSNFVQYLENLKNVGNRNEDFNLTRNLPDILADTKLTMNKLIKMGDAQSGVLEKIMNVIIETRTKWEKIYMPTENNRTNINQDIENTLKEILNYTEISEIKRDEYLKELVQILKEKMQVEYKLPDTQQVSHTQESSTSEDPKPQQIMGVASQLISSSANTTPRGSPPILTFMAVLLTIITALLFLFGYVVFTKGRYFVNPASNVEMAHLVESRPDSINK
ncbi:unnamed protein product [Callosobruchus maculatus]|uniref:Uncharacterized protein n=1 Tax=Callosobruchus maculatus TaxID=64391 RepID=A0A653BGZ6_CALMS|nr:unnamed protein product [Callosobruchus maculatus]